MAAGIGPSGSILLFQGMTGLEPSFISRCPLIVDTNSRFYPLRRTGHQRGCACCFIAGAAECGDGDEWKRRLIGQ